MEEEATFYEALLINGATDFAPFFTAVMKCLHTSRQTLDVGKRFLPIILRRARF